ncbi:MAG TPA: folylpolyglutamate synthase/dihydrofolate synthase family protein [Clostridia bacterium]|nr:MAG: Folylpolyglutamate synthase [Firmicutes bacterium ADurb.Bin146]HOD92460.1 folylpolyglutamate synthase/dihydrofolate synthase family protein [Clostridia bacterium]HQM38817.1 folylpolyglutamate synthase/dihydrofolate synthase family protein [Clostridia bacterium]
MNYNDAVAYIHSASKFGSKLGLANITKLLDLLDNPHKDMKFIHVAGTNGKGSTCSYIAHILYAAGYKTGLFISPYVESFGERMQVDFQNIDDDSLINNVQKVKENIDVMLEEGYNHPTEFEIDTAIAMMYFKQKECDVVVLEVGLGGRLDSTNVISSPLATVICTIEKDHMAILGDTLEKIAFEKAGIIKKGSPVVVYGGNEQCTYDVIKTQAEKIGALYSVVNFNSINNIRYHEYSYTFNFENYKDLKINMFGDYQIKNACTAVKAIEASMLNVTEEAIKEGLLNTKWPGRLEILSKNPLIICDGAHNPEGIRSLKNTLIKYFPEKRKIFVMAVMKNKEYEKMIEDIFPLAETAIAVRPSYDRALELEVLKQTIQKHCKNTYTFDKIDEGLDYAVAITDENSIICTFGSLYYIADVKNYIRKMGQ